MKIDLAVETKFSVGDKVFIVSDGYGGGYAGPGHECPICAVIHHGMRDRLAVEGKIVSIDVTYQQVRHDPPLKLIRYQIHGDFGGATFSENEVFSLATQAEKLAHEKNQEAASRLRADRAKIAGPDGGVMPVCRGARALDGCWRGPALDPTHYHASGRKTETCSRCGEVRSERDVVWIQYRRPEER